jgi:DNA repair protein RadD
MPFVLRPYQSEAINALHGYWRANGGNGLIVLPTGSGKSLVIAALCQEMLKAYPSMRIGIVTHVRELIMQNYMELMALWPQAPAGIYSSGIGRRDRDAKILFMGVQSVWRRVNEIGAFDLLLVDEAHLVSHHKTTTYRKLMDKLREKTPDMRVAGLTATAFRLDTGRLDTGDNKLFDDVVYDANVRDLINQGYLCKLLSKRTVQQMDVSKVGKQAGEFIVKELEIAVDQDWITKGACQEIVDYGGDGKRKAWLAFCVTVAHAEHVVQRLRDLGVTCHCVFGHTLKADRDRIIQGFRDGEFTCLVSVMVLGIGFNVPQVDLIALLRPTASAGLFVQQVGRGLRNAEGKKDCLVLDFAGNTLRHGPIDLVKGKTIGAQTLVCPTCAEILPPDTKVCPECGFVFVEDPRPAGVDNEDIDRPTESKIHKPTADDQTDIVSDSTPRWLDVSAVSYSIHYKYGNPTAPPTLKVSYRCGFFTHSEWICFEHQGYAREKAVRWWQQRVSNVYDWTAPGTIDEAILRQGELAAPLRIMVRPEGRFMKILNVELQPPLPGVMSPPG